MTAPWIMEGIDGRRLERAVARLGNSDFGVAWLTSIGLTMPFAKTAGIGIEGEDEGGAYLVHVVRGRDGVRRLGRLRIDADGALRALVPGAPVTVWSRAHAEGGHALVLPDVETMWRLVQAVGDEGLERFVVLAPSHPGVPLEWRDGGFWRSFATVTVVADDASGGGAVTVLAAAAGAAATLALPGVPAGWRRLLAPGGGFAGDVLDGLVADAAPLAHFLGGMGSAPRTDARAYKLNYIFIDMVG